MTWLDKAWHDPVGSKLVAEAIKGLAKPAYAWIAGIFALLLAKPAWFKAIYGIPVWAWAILGLVFYLLIAVLVLVILWKRNPAQISRDGRADIRKVEVLATDPLPGTTLTYPVKCNLTLLNASQTPVDVRVVGFEPGAVTLQEMKLNTLLLQLNGTWWPTNNAVERIAVFPGQQFRAWIAVDHTKFDAAKVNELRGRIGTLTLDINGQVTAFKM